MIRFFVGGVPKSMQVGKTVRVKAKEPQSPDRHFQVRRNTEWAVLVGHIGRQHAPPTPIAGPVEFEAVFYMPRPQGLPKSVLIPEKNPDVDGLVHKLTDQFNGVFYFDDGQICDFIARKRYAVGGRVGVEIVVRPARVELAQLAMEGATA